LTAIGFNAKVILGIETRERATMIDINCDLGEGTSKDSFEHDKKLMQYVKSINLACGFHAGDYKMMGKIIDYALSQGIQVGAHPGYDDKENFGRMAIEMTKSELEDLLTYQIGAIRTMVEVRGGRLHHVKLHGALYNQCAKDPVKAKLVGDLILRIDPDLLVYGPYGSIFNQVLRDMGLRVYDECFADRRYDGYNLAPRKDQGVIRQVNGVLSHVKQIVVAKAIQDKQGQILPVECQTLCVHGDHEESLQVLKVISNFLEAYESSSH